MTELTYEEYEDLSMSLDATPLDEYNSRKQIEWLFEAIQYYWEFRNEIREHKQWIGAD